MKNLQALSLLLVAFLFVAVSCGDDEIILSGTYTADDLVTECPGGVGSFETSGDELCIDVDGVKTTAVIQFTFTGTNYTTNFIQTTPGVGVETTTQTGTFDINAENGEVCIIGICGQIDASNGGDNIVWTGVNGEGCDVRLELERG